MFDKDITHWIQKHIISVLLHQPVARFRDMRPAKTDTNLYSYHLKLLVKQGFIEKTDDGYRLGVKGMLYVDRVNADKIFVRSQPKIVTMLVVQNAEGDILLQYRDKQPYIDTWTLPYGKLHSNDVSIEDAAQREAREKLGLVQPAVVHAGDCYIRVTTKGNTLTTTLAHVFTCASDGIVMNDHLQWARPHKLAGYRLAPAVEAIMTRTFFGDDHFFEEFEQEWRN